MTKLTDGCGEHYNDDQYKCGYVYEYDKDFERIEYKSNEFDDLCPKCQGKIEGYNLAKKEDIEKIKSVQFPVITFNSDNIKTKEDIHDLIEFINDAWIKKFSAISAEISDGGKE